MNMYAEHKPYFATIIHIYLVDYSVFYSIFETLFSLVVN